MTQRTDSTQPDLTADARHRATRFIADQIRRWPDLDLRPLDIAGLDERDARLAQALTGEVIRRWLTLDRLLNARLDRSLIDLETNLQAVLLVGAAQVFFFDSVPDHAVVNEAVAWAKRRVRQRAGGLVNAVLRRMIELRGETVGSQQEAGPQCLPLADGRWLRLAAAVLPDDPVERLACQTSHPVGAVRRWLVQRSFVETERLALHNLIMAPTLIVGLAPETIRADDRLTSHRESGFAVWSGPHAALVELLAANPSARVQDPASYEVVRRLREATDVTGVIADVCAGSGTKTAHLAEAFPNARIVATDIDQRRFRLLAERFTGSEQVLVVEPARLVEFARQVDLILLDVPCSNTGTLARRVEAKYRIDSRHLEALVALQKQVIADHLALRSDRGLIAYSTCSLEPEENEAQTAWMNRWHRTRVLTEFSRRPTGLPGDSPAAYSDGGYLALLG